MKEKILEYIKRDNVSFETLIRLTELEREELEKIIRELIAERKIFLNASKKYESMKPEYQIGILEKTSKGAAYAVVNGEKIYIAPNNLHTALKNDLVVIEESYDNTGIIRGIIKRKNEKLVCEVREWHNKLVLVPFNGNC